jgi:hypothetical protein
VDAQPPGLGFSSASKHDLVLVTISWLPNLRSVRLQELGWPLKNYIIDLSRVSFPRESASAIHLDFQRSLVMALTPTVYGFLALTLVFLVISYIKRWNVERKFQKWARDQGAEPAAQVQFKLPFGIDGTWRVINADRLGLDIFDDIIVFRMKQMGRHTLESAIQGDRVLNTADPRNIQTLLATNFNHFAIGERRRAQFGVLLGESIFNVDGPAWAHARALFRPQFSRDNINDLGETERATEILIDVIQRESDGWTKPVDMMPLFFRFTLDTSTAFIFGETVDSQLAASGQTPHGSGPVTGDHLKFAEAFSASNRWLASRTQLQRLYALSDGPKQRAAARMVRNFANQFIQKALQSRTNLRKAEAEKYSVVEELAKATQDPIELRDQVLGLLAIPMLCMLGFGH